MGIWERSRRERCSEMQGRQHPAAGRSTAGQQGREHEGPTWAGSGGPCNVGGTEKRGAEQDFEAAGELAELLGREVRAGVSSAASKAGR